MKWFSLLVRLALGALLLTAFCAKVFDSQGGEPGPQRFAAFIAAQGLVPAPWASAVASAVLAAELAVGAALLAFDRGPARRFAGYAAVVLLACFSTYLVLVFRRQGVVDCACFGRLAPADLRSALARNTACIALLGLSLLHRPHPHPAAAPPAPPP